MDPSRSNFNNIICVSRCALWYKYARRCIAGKLLMWRNTVLCSRVLSSSHHRYNYRILYSYRYIKKSAFSTSISYESHILRRNCLLQQVIEGKIKGQIEVTRRRGRRRRKLLDDLKDRRGYCQLKEEALDRTVWRNRFGKGFGPVVWQITDDDDDDDDDLMKGLYCNFSV